MLSVNSFVDRLFAHLQVTNDRLTLFQFKQAAVAEPRLAAFLMLDDDEDGNVDVSFLSKWINVNCFFIVKNVRFFNFLCSMFELFTKYYFFSHFTFFS